MNIETCSYRSNYSDSGDRGADMHEHYRAFHPDHTHVWGPSTYGWEQGKGVERCTVCALAQQDDSSGLCGK